MDISAPSVTLAILRDEKIFKADELEAKAKKLREEAAAIDAALSALKCQNIECE